MSGLRGRAGRMLGSWLPSLSARRRDWVEAALAELPEVPDRRVLGWTLGIGAIALGDMFEQAFLPWRRGKDARPPAGFAALTGLLLLALPAYLIAAILIWPGVSYGRGAVVASVLAIGLSLWVNLAAVAKAESLGGLIYAVGIRRLPLNLAAILLAAILAFLVSQAPLT